MIEYISFITAFNITAIAMRKYKTPMLLLIANLVITVLIMAVVEMIGEN